MGKTKNLKKLLIESDGRCPLCREPLDLQMVREYIIWRGNKGQKRGNRPTMKGINIDHVMPLSKGGKNCVANMQLVHTRCNYLKGDYVGIIHPAVTPWILES